MKIKYTYLYHVLEDILNYRIDHISKCLMGRKVKLKLWNYEITEYDR